jgi:hypothetical protein
VRRRSGAARYVRALVVGLIASLCGAVTLAAQTQRGAAPPPGSELRIAVLTMGVGAASWERFGHNAIVVEDRLRGTSLAYNYGMFSFRQENFLLRFIQGRMTYWMEATPTELVVPAYRRARRSVWEQELNLTPAERLAMREFLEWNARPENKFYRYDYYRDNCSTRVRDAIDRVLGGAFRAQMGGPAAGSFRFHTARLNTHNPALYTGLMLATGQGADQPVTRWDEMFLPLKLREYLREVRVRDSTGQEVPIVSAERTLYESPVYAERAAPPGWLPWYLAIGAVLGGVMALGARSRGRSTPWLTQGVAVAWALVSGTVGLVLTGLWAFTDHAIARNNENVLQFSLLALALGVLLLLRRPDRPRLEGAVRALAVLVAACSVLGLLLKLLPGFDQVNGQLIALALPANLGLALASLKTPAAAD